MLQKELTKQIEPNATMRAVEALGKKYPNAIPIFGGALWIDHANIDAIVDYLPTIVSNTKFFGWHGGLADACRTFCSLCFTDPMLVEAYIGMKFEKLTEEN